jgi:pyruvate dehydrogenase E2 component (dihydrolipoamide acetyltransferase)
LLRLRLSKRTGASPWHGNPDDRNWFHQWGQVKEIEAVDGGVLHLAPDAPAAGQTVLVGRTIARLCAAGEAPTWSATPAATAPAATPRTPTPATSAAAAPPAGSTGGDPPAWAIPAAASPTVRRLARQIGVDLTTIVPRLPGGRLSIEDLASPTTIARPVAPVPEADLRTSPRARRAARERGVDIASLRGSGVGGRIRERDVLAAAAAATGGLPSAPGAVRQPLTQTRRTIARQMVRSRQETVPVTLTAWADATALLAARAAGKAADGPEAATLNDMLLVILGRTLVAHPLLAARWDETHLVLPGDRIDVGLAVDAPGGLVVPVVRDVAAAPLAEVARRTRALVDRARAGRLAAADMQGGVFTLTSLGSYGIEFFTPVINHPEAAILGVGAIRTQPVPPAAGQAGFAFQPQLSLSLTFDHRIVDGGPAARFLGDLAGRIAAFDPAAAS